MECATYMCEEIVIEILSRLPVKSLIRFMAVCRLWKSIITSTQFRLDSKRPSKFLVHTGDRGFYTLVEEEKRLMFETDFPFKHCFNDSATVIGSDNGLVCYSYNRGHHHHHRVIIWNPCVRKHVVVIPALVGDETFYLREYASGFGGTTSGRDYKYVRLVEEFFFDHVVEGSSKKTSVEIYSLRAGTWRRKYLDDDSDITPSFVICALLRGRLHWVGGLEKQIFSFELEDEVFDNKIITVPESIQSIEQIYVGVTVIRESLAVIATERHSSTVCVWVMEEYGDVSSWNKLWNIVPQGFFNQVGSNMFHLMKDGELLLGFRGIDYPTKHKLVTCNPKTMGTCDFGLSLFPEASGFTYKESLVLLGDHYHAAAAADHWYPFLQKEHPVSVGIPFSGFFVLVLAEL